MRGALLHSFRNALVFCVLLTAASLSMAHVNHDGDIAIAIDSIIIDPVNSEQLLINLAIHNTTGRAVTLRKISSSVAKKVEITRYKTVFGKQREQAVRFLRIEAEKTIDLTKPNYQVVMKNLAYEAKHISLIELEFDFGTAGKIKLSDIRE